MVGRLFGAAYVLRLSTMLLPGLVAPGILAIAALRGRFRAEALGTLRDWAPLVFVAVVFDNLENYTGLVRKLTIDNTLYHIDLAIFGVEPSVWMKHLYHPLVTDWMASCYAIFLITPMFLAIAVSLRGRREDFREIRAAVMLQMWIAFFMFICLPAGRRATSRRCATGPIQTGAAVVLRLQRRVAGALGYLQPAFGARVVPVAALRVRDLCDVGVRVALR